MTVRLSDYIGNELEEDFDNFDLSEIKDVLDTLINTNVIDIAHVEYLQQQSLRGADILSEYLGKVVKTVNYLESQVNIVKNRSALNYQAPEGAKVTADMRKFASEISTEVENLQIRLSKSKAAKVVLEKKYEILIKSHHHYKDIAMGMRKTILGYGNNTGSTGEKVAEGYE